MKTIIELISNEVMTAFKEAGYDENYGKGYAVESAGPV